MKLMILLVLWLEYHWQVLVILGLSLLRLALGSRNGYSIIYLINQ